MSQRPTISRHRLADPLRTEYLRYSAGAAGTAAETLVLVHGQSREVDALVHAFLPWAARRGLHVIAPEFTVERHRGYQRLRTCDPGISAVRVLDDVLADAGVRDDARVLLFGFSGGAQFAHRYVIVRPYRVAALSIAAAGWYTFPALNQPFPYGVAPGSLPCSEGHSLSDLFALPVQVLVGERDTKRDASLRCSRRVDRQQGPNRVTRALAWVEAVRRLSPDAGPPELEVLPRAGHRFGRCVRAGMVERATDWFDRHLEAGEGRLALPGSSPCSTVPESAISTIGVEESHGELTET